MSRKASQAPSASVMLLTVIAVVHWSGVCALSAEQQARPNILFIMSDDHGYQALSCYGSRVNQTPNLDRIANEGMRFDRCFVTNSICGPSRATILTGKYSHLNGFARNGDVFYGGQQHVGRLLGKAGYQTAVIGKWHLKSVPTGFDYYHVLQGQGPYYNPVMLTSGGTVPHEGYTTDIITDVALEWLQQRSSDKPFFMMCQHKAPHRNWQPGPKYLNKYDDVTVPEPATLFDDYAGRGMSAKQQKMTIAEDMNEHDLKLVRQRNRMTDQQRSVFEEAYAAKNNDFAEAGLEGEALVRWKYQRYVKDYLRCVDSVDENVGRLLDYLEASGLAENTLVVYTSDQGWYLGEHGWFDKRWMYEESFRTPLLVRWPSQIKGGSVCNALAMNLDFAETFLDIAGTSVPADMQGRSLKPILLGQTPADWRSSLYYHYYEYPGPHSVRRHYGIRTDRYKLIYFYEQDVNQWELYDLEEDPREMRSVYADPAYQDVVRKLKADLQAKRDQYRDDGSVAQFLRNVKRPVRVKSKAPDRKQAQNK